MINEAIRADLYRYSGESPSGKFLPALLIPGFRFMYIFRKAAEHPKKSIRGFLYRILLQFHSVVYGFQIPPSTSIGKGLYIGHWGTIIVNGKSIIGANCNLSPGVTIGQTNRGNNKGVPIIGSKVWIGTNAVVVGNVSIGDNVLIAPNSFVNISVPSNSLVVGNPATIVPKENATDGYIDFIFDPDHHP
jgi:serine O-acetyltransferase